MNLYIQRFSDGCSVDPVSLLPLLPLWLRRELLAKLPIADVCVPEEGPFIHGMDTEKVWKRLDPEIDLVWLEWDLEYLVSYIILSAKHLVVDMDRWHTPSFTIIDWFAKALLTVIATCTTEDYPYHRKK